MAAALLRELTKSAPDHIEGQLSFDEDNQLMRKIAMATDVSPLQRARMREAALALKDGRKTIPLRCAFCRSSSVRAADDPHNYEPRLGVVLTCAACGKDTRKSTAQAERVREIKAFIKEGIDLPMLKNPRWS